MDKRVRQVSAVIGPLDRLAEPVEHRQLPGRYLADHVFEQLSGRGDLLARAADDRGVMPSAARLEPDPRARVQRSQQPAEQRR
jgi:hypothetical protein